ncbi:hypothetical protein VNO77_06045 [Canavalia gladiata]|uniref:Uncharacterized protein n=1 Tax=Canavalia gladiata TaxID=3824 RepID=A0AAN9MZE1_CANGL
MQVKILICISNANERMKEMEQTLIKAKQIQDDCATAVKKLKAVVESTKEKLGEQKKQTSILNTIDSKNIA